MTDSRRRLGERISPRGNSAGFASAAAESNSALIERTHPATLGKAG
jgi:hypothetical protein